MVNYELGFIKEIEGKIMNQSFSVSVNIYLMPNKSTSMEKRIEEEQDRVMNFLTKGNRKLKKRENILKIKK